MASTSFHSPKALFLSSAWRSFHPWAVVQAGGYNSRHDNPCIACRDSPEWQGWPLVAKILNMLHYQSTNNHAGGLVACTVVSVLQSLVVFLLYLVPGKIVSKLHPAVGLAQSRERLLKLKQLVIVVLGVVFHVDSC